MPQTTGEDLQRQAELVRIRWDEYMTVLRREPENDSARHPLWLAHQVELSKLSAMEQARMKK